MVAFYRERFSNAADFTFFMVGAFKVDEVMPLLARYVGGLPSRADQPKSAFRDIGITFPPSTSRRTVEKGREPKSETVISFFADPPMDPMEQERVSAATDVLEIALRDILREELGQTYTVSVGLSRAAAAARRGPRRGQLRRVARQHRQDDRARAAGSPEDADGRTVRRPAQSREGNRAPRTTRRR